MNQLLLHVGVHKTGSTSIQYTLNLNKQRLLDNGIILYPWKNHSRFYRAFTDTPQSFHGYYRKWNRTTGQSQLKDQLKKYFLENTDSDHIVSGEDICLLSVSALSALNNFFREECGFSKVTIVCFLREPLDYLNSSLQQFLKPGLLNLNEIKDNTLFSYRLQGCPEFSGGLHSILTQIYFPIPQKLVTAFGKKNVEFIRFENAINTGLAQNALNLFENHNNLQCDDIEPINTSMSHEACLLLGEYNNRNPLLGDNMEINKKRARNRVIPVIRWIPGKPARLIDPTLLDFKMIMTGINTINSIAGFHVLTPISGPPDKYKHNSILTFSSNTVSFLKNLIDFNGVTQTNGSGTISTEHLTNINTLLEKRYKTRLRSGFYKLRQQSLSYISQSRNGQP